MKEVALRPQDRQSEAMTFAASLATVLELPLREVPIAPAGEDPLANVPVQRWLGGMGLGMVPVAQPDGFSWAGPWLARIQPAGGGQPSWLVMYGGPSGPVWDPGGVTAEEGWSVIGGCVIAAADVALARPPKLPPPDKPGVVEGIWVAPAAGELAQSLERALALPGRGLEGDRHVSGKGTFPSGVPGSALTLIEAEVCGSLSPPLTPNEHRRNVVTRGIGLNSLVGYDFMIGGVRCRGTRLCEPCKVIVGYAGRPLLRALVHRGGLRADIVEGGEIAVGDPVVVIGH